MANIERLSWRPKWRSHLGPSRKFCLWGEFDFQGFPPLSPFFHSFLGDGLFELEENFLSLEYFFPLFFCEPWLELEEWLRWDEELWLRERYFPAT